VYDSINFVTPAALKKNGIWIVFEHPFEQFQICTYGNMAILSLSFNFSVRI